MVLAIVLCVPGMARALPGPFTDVTAAAGVSYQHVDATPTFDDQRHVAGGGGCGDYDGDGWLDLYVVRGDAGPNLLFRHRGDGTFEEVGVAAGVAVSGTYAGPTFADVTEGSGGIWERLRYDWSDPNRVVLTTTDSNVFGGDSGHVYTFKRNDDGTTDIRLHHVDTLHRLNACRQRFEREHIVPQLLWCTVELISKDSRRFRQDGVRDE